MDINCNGLKVHLNIAKTSLEDLYDTGPTYTVAALALWNDVFWNDPNPTPPHPFPRSMWLVCLGNFYGCFSSRIDRLTVESPSLGLVYCYWFIDGLCL